MSYTVLTLNLKELSPDKRQSFALLLPPKYRCTLDGLDPDAVSFAKIIGVGMFYKNDPVGIAIASNYQGTGLAELYCLQLDNQHRDLSLAKKLLSKLEDECFQTDAVIINHHYRKQSPDFGFSQTLFKEQGWSKPKLTMERYFFDCYTFCPPWFTLHLKLPKKFKIFSWKDLKPEEKKALEIDQYQGQFSAYESPFQNEKTIDWKSSLGLRYKGRVVGWMVTHLVAHDTLRYTILFVRPEFQSKGYGIRLLVESIKLQQQSPVRWSLFELNLEMDNASWRRFVRRRLAPYAISTDQIFQTWKKAP